jgi:hypothetical protein
MVKSVEGVYRIDPDGKITRIITDGNPSFDEIPYGYRGKLYLEIVPRSYAIQVKTGLALNQLRLFTGDARLRRGAGHVVPIIGPGDL